MKKLSLRMDALRVETFAASDASSENQGTVRAHLAPSQPYTCLCPQTATCPSWTGINCDTVCAG